MAGGPGPFTIPLGAGLGRRSEKAHLAARALAGRKRRRAEQLLASRPQRARLASGCQEAARA